MKLNIALVLILLAAAVVPSAHAQQCSVAGAVGKYAFSDSGTVINVGPRAAVGLLTFDAATNITGNINASLDGIVTHTKLSGTYTVNPDCSGTASFGEFDPQTNDLILTATVAIVWDAGMQEARFLFTSIVLANDVTLGAAINGSARKLGVSQQ